MSNSGQGNRRHRAGISAALAVLGLLAALSRLPLIRTPVDVLPDGCEYLGIARHLVAQRRWVSSIKWHFFTQTPVVHPALADRPPLYPLWAAGWVAMSSHPPTQVWLARAGNLMLAAAVPPMIYWSLASTVAPAAAGLSALMFLFYPGFIRNSAQPLTEPLFLLLLFSSLGLFLRARMTWHWATCGLLSGLAFLTRPTGVILPLLYAAVLVCRLRSTSLDGARPRPNMPSELGALTAEVCPSTWKALLAFMVGFVLPLLPYWAGVAAQTGSPFASVLRYNYSILQIDEGTFSGFERSFEPPARFVRENAAAVARKVIEQWATMGSALRRSLQFLLPLILFWRWRGIRWGHGVIIGLALLNFLIHAMSWTVWGAARYMFPSYIIGMAVLLDAPLRWAEQTGRPGRRWLVNGSTALAVALTMAECGVQDVRLYQEKAKPFGGVHLGWAYAAAGERLAQLPAGVLCATNQPWIVNLLARRPAVMAPRLRDLMQLRRYLSLYHPSTLTLFVTEREPGDVRTARELVEELWGHPRLRPELSDLLKLEVAEERAAAEVPNGPGRRESSNQALLMFRVLSVRSGREGLLDRRTVALSRPVGMMDRSGHRGKR